MASLALVMFQLFSVSVNAAEITTDSLKLMRFADSLVKVFEDDGLSAGQIHEAFEKNNKRFKASMSKYLEIEEQVILAFSCLEYNQFDIANQLAIDVLKASRILGYKSGIASAHQVLAHISHYLDEHEKAMRLADSVYRFYEILGEDSLLTAPLILKATVDINHSRAIENLEQAALIATKKGDLSTLSSVYHNLSYEYFEVENLKAAAVYVQKSYAVSEQINSAKTWAYHYWLEANLAFRLQDYVKAEISFNKSLAHVSDSSKAVGLSCFSALVQLNIKKKQFQKALNLLQLRNQLLTINTEKEFENRRQIYEEIQRLNKDNYLQEVRFEKIAFEQTRLRIIILASIVIVLLLFFVVYLQARNKKKLEQINQTITLNKKLIENKNRELTDSINYAQRVQNSLLPREEKTKKLLKDHFILFLPRDIVSGDFYWAASNEAGTYFAVADCTGHGVPGAMVSSVCYNALNKSLKESLTKPAQILNRTRELIVNEFDEADEALSDGMDIAMCLINGENLEYAGAYNPLIIIRDHELIEIKADKQPVGKFIQYKPFTNQRFQLKKGDVMYIFSDGFADQFGGDKGKKFKTTKFKALLLEIHQLPMADQKRKLREIFEGWKSSYSQVDDVSVLGMRV
jgi:serine phosphatase RsbU (regulator of sigma subunit)